MALAFQSGESIKQALYEELQNILSPDKVIRTGAESRMKHLEFTEGINFNDIFPLPNSSRNLIILFLLFLSLNFLGYGVYLAEFIMNQSFDLALRQLACVMLTKYVEEHWNVSEDDNNVVADAATTTATTTTVVASDQAKQMIRKILPNGLYDSNSKIRVSVAYTISTIASMDWPHTWTELFDIIVKCLGGNEDSIHGGMQVLVEFTYDLNSQISVVGPIILSEIYRIFEAEQVSAKIYNKKINLFCLILKMIYFSR